MDPRFRGDDGPFVVPAHAGTHFDFTNNLDPRFRGDDARFVIPAHAGTHFDFTNNTWIPAFAGMTARSSFPRTREPILTSRTTWIPAFAGMTPGSSFPRTREPILTSRTILGS